MQFPYKCRSLMHVMNVKLLFYDLFTFYSISFVRPILTFFFISFLFVDSEIVYISHFQNNAIWVFDAHSVFWIENLIPKEVCTLVFEFCNDQEGKSRSKVCWMIILRVNINNGFVMTWLLCEQKQQQIEIN